MSCFQYQFKYHKAMFYVGFFILLFFPSIQGTTAMDFRDRFSKLLSLFKQEDPSVCTALVYGNNFSFDLKFPAIRMDHLKSFESSSYLFNKCYFLLLEEKHSGDLKFIIERVTKVFNGYPKFSIILIQTEPGNVIFENKENSPLAFISNKVHSLYYGDVT